MIFYYRCFLSLYLGGKLEFASFIKNIIRNYQRFYEKFSNKRIVDVCTVNDMRKALDGIYSILNVHTGLSTSKKNYSFFLMIYEWVYYWQQRKESQSRLTLCSHLRIAGLKYSFFSELKGNRNFSVYYFTFTCEI